jgi:hypothetical protein
VAIDLTLPRSSQLHLYLGRQLRGVCIMQCCLSSTSLSRKAGRCARLLCLLLWWSHLWIGSAMPQRAPPKTTKTWCLLNTPMIRLQRTLIPDNQPLRRGTTQDSMEVTDCVSASRMNSRTLTVHFRIIFIAHYMCYICSRELVWGIHQNVTPLDCLRSARFSIGLW